MRDACLQENLPLRSASKTQLLSDAAKLLEHGPAAKSTKANVMVSPCCQPPCRHFMLCTACVHAMQYQLTVIVIVCNVLVEAALLTVAWLPIPGLCPRCMSSLLTTPPGHSTPSLD